MNRDLPRGMQVKRAAHTYARALLCTHLKLPFSCRSAPAAPCAAPQNAAPWLIRDTCVLDTSGPMPHDSTTLRPQGCVMESISSCNTGCSDFSNAGGCAMSRPSKRA